MINWTFTGMTIAWTLTSDSKIAKAIKISSKNSSIGITVAVHQLLIMWQNS